MGVLGATGPTRHAPRILEDSLQVVNLPSKMQSIAFWWKVGWGAEGGLASGMKILTQSI